MIYYRAMSVAQMPLPTAPPERVPFEVFEQMDETHFELVDGQLVEKNVSLKSSEAGILTARLLGDAAVASGRVKALDQSMIYRCFPDDPDRSRRPDLSVVLLDKLTATGRSDPGYLIFPPDLAVEIVSKNDTSEMVRNKVFDYQDAGFPLVWVLDPYYRTLRIFSAEHGDETLEEDEEVTLPDLMPSFCCRVGDMLPPKA